MYRSVSETIVLLIQDVNDKEELKTCIENIQSRINIIDIVDKKKPRKQKICLCGEKVHAKGFCIKCYLRERARVARMGKPPRGIPLFNQEGHKCSDYKITAKGLCNSCYQREYFLKRNGSPRPLGRKRNSRNDLKEVCTYCGRDFEEQYGNKICKRISDTSDICRSCYYERYKSTDRECNICGLELIKTTRDICQICFDKRITPDMNKPLTEIYTRDILTEIKLLLIRFKMKMVGLPEVYRLISVYTDITGEGYVNTDKIDNITQIKIMLKKIKDVYDSNKTTIEVV